MISLHDDNIIMMGMSSSSVNTVIKVDCGDNITVVKSQLVNSRVHPKMIKNDRPMIAVKMLQENQMSVIQTTISKARLTESQLSVRDKRQPQNAIKKRRPPVKTRIGEGDQLKMASIRKEFQH